MHRYAIRNSLIVSALLAAAIGAGIYLEAVAAHKQHEAAMRARLEAASNLLEADVEEIAALARAIADSSSVAASLRGEAPDSTAIERDFLAQLRHHPRLMQIRLIDAGGRERVRVHRGPDGPVVVPPTGLQEKGERYYIREAEHLARGEVYLSRLDLNVEHGEVVHPPTSVLRVVTVTEPHANVVLNADGSAVVQRLGGVDVVQAEDVPAWAHGSGQAWADGTLRTWTELELFGRKLTLLAQAPSPPSARPPPAVALPVWGILLVGAWWLARHQDARARHEEQLKHLNKRLLAVQEEERRRVARWLHDELSQRVTAVSLQIQRGAAMTDAERRGAVLELARAGTDGVLTSVHDLAEQLRTPVLDDLGLKPALDEMTRRLDVACTLDVALDRALPSHVSEQAYRIIEEAGRNAERHAECSQLTVRVATQGAALMIEVRDDGKGFDPGGSGGLGMLGMRERAELLGGSLLVDSSPGGGTIVRATLPLESP